MNQIKRALLSVSDKTGVLELAQQLDKLGVELLSTGGTAKLLAEAGLPVKEVSSHTGFPEMMDGRIKTLHPKIHGGLLGRRGKDDAIMTEHDIAPIDLVVVNLYPFEATIARDDCTLPMAIENIDIGGPTMLRAAAKNHADVTVLIDPADYANVVAQIETNGGVDDATRFDLAVKTFEHTAHYDGTRGHGLLRRRRERLDPELRVCPVTGFWHRRRICPAVLLLGAATLSCTCLCSVSRRSSRAIGPSPVPSLFGSPETTCDMAST